MIYGIALVTPFLRLCLTQHILILAACGVWSIPRWKHGKLDIND